MNGSRFAAKYNYASTGHLHYVSDAADGSVYWAAEETNALGQVTKEYTRNGVETVKTRNPVTGWLLGSSSTAQANVGTVIQKWSYRYDVLGDLTGRTRSDALNNSTMNEEFTYDPLERLHTSGVTTSTGVNISESYTYDNLGNLLSKAGKGYSYSGCQAGPHAVCAVDGSAFVYDARGNIISGAGRHLCMTAVTRPSTSGAPRVLLISCTGPMAIVWFRRSQTVLAAPPSAPFMLG